MVLFQKKKHSGTDCTIEVRITRKLKIKVYLGRQESFATRTFLRILQKNTQSLDAGASAPFPFFKKKTTVLICTFGETTQIS
jgi:aromatic ring-opening dioxygenase LigB subunit